MIRNRISIFIVSFIIVGFFFLSLPEKGYSGADGMFPPVAEGSCCQLDNECFDLVTEIPDEPDGPIQLCLISNVRPGFCNVDTGMCELPEISRNVPTLSQWGLIFMAGVMGIIALFIIIRRRTITA
jgi:hypothetical protein